jgi:hypothetical protein
MSDNEAFLKALAFDCSGDDTVTVEDNVYAVARDAGVKVTDIKRMWQHDCTFLVRATFEDGSVGYAMMGYNPTGEDDPDDYEIYPVPDPVNWLKAKAADLHKQAKACRDAAHAALHTIGAVQLMEGGSDGQQESAA